MTLNSHNLGKRGFLTLREHLDQIRAAVNAIRQRHSRRLLQVCADAWDWLVEAIALHDVGKASPQFQRYILAPDRHLRRPGPDMKSHTPLSTAVVLALAREEAWTPSRGFAIAQIVNGHHSALEPRNELIDKVMRSEEILEAQLPGVNWILLADQIRRELGVVCGLSAEEFTDEGQRHLDQLFRSIQSTGEVAFRLRVQLAFSVLLEADKAFLAVAPENLARYLEGRRDRLDSGVVDRLLAQKPKSDVNPIRIEARGELLAGMARHAEKRVQTLTLPTGTGKTLLAATWALTHRANRAEGDEAPLVLIVLPFLSIIDQTIGEYQKLFADAGLDAGDLISYHSLSDRTYAPDLEDSSQDFFLDTWHSSLVITTFDQFLMALLSPQGRHQMRFHNLTDALIVLDEVQTLPTRIWEPLRAALEGLVEMGTSRVLAMSATNPGFLPQNGELIHDPAAFFQQMRRYTLVLRHQQPMRLKDFVAKCVSRLPEWSGKKVLITLNTRRSARVVMEALRKARAKVEFITADVNPHDRLAAIERVKGEGACIVVSTQCIEAGVDIDMDHVIRDFGPLDSLIQVAGRCNRNGRPMRGVVEIVSLQEDDRNKTFASYIYDDVLRSVTADVLGHRSEVPEEEVYPLTLEYYRRLAMNKDKGDELLAKWKSWADVDPVRVLLRGKQPKKVSFVVIEQDPALRGELVKALEVPDRWERKRAMRKLAACVARRTVTVYCREGLEPESYGEGFPPGKAKEDVWFWLLDKGHYTAECGLTLGADVVDEVGWGVVI